jgi:hypothetical protein
MNEKDRPNKYWMVHCIEKGWPIVRHNVYFKAAEEAKRLARKNPGHKFYLLQAASCFEVDCLPVKQTTL